jgi:hypothetical protein
VGADTAIEFLPRDCQAMVIDGTIRVRLTPVLTHLLQVELCKADGVSHRRRGQYQVGNQQ